MGSKIQQYLHKTIYLALFFLVVIFLLRFFVIEPSRVSGESMAPLLADNDVIFINKASLLFRSPEKNDIVQLFDPLDQHKLLVKRIVAVPGETVVYEKQNIILPENYYFVQGDNFLSSYDSKDFGPIHRKLIIGLVETKKIK